jgi:hypothetical protein
MNVIEENDKAIMVFQSEYNSYEVFIRLTNRRRNSKIDYCIPDDEDFGVWAWSVNNEDRARKIFNEITTGIRSIRPMLEDKFY